MIGRVPRLKQHGPLLIKGQTGIYQKLCQNDSFVTYNFSSKYRPLKDQSKLTDSWLTMSASIYTSMASMAMTSKITFGTLRLGKPMKHSELPVEVNQEGKPMIHNDLPF